MPLRLLPCVLTQLLFCSCPLEVALVRNANNKNHSIRSSPWLLDVERKLVQKFGTQQLHLGGISLSYMNTHDGFLLAHLSRRLTGELIGYPWIRLPLSSSVRLFTFSNVFCSETAWPIKAKFNVEPPWEGGTVVCINGPGHMTKMAAKPIYGKNLK